MYEAIDSKDTAWFALALAAVYVALSWQTRSRATDLKAAQTIDLLHLALAIGFITVAIPIRLDAHWVTIGWFAEAAVLLWVADRVHSELLNIFALGALILGVGRLLLFDNFYVDQPISIRVWQLTQLRLRCWVRSPGSAAGVKMKPRISCLPSALWP